MNALLLGGAAGCSADDEEPAPVEAAFTGAPGEVRLLTLEPGHFHAALVQKYAYDQIDSVVHVYAPTGAELDAHVELIEGFNTRSDDPTAWSLRFHTDPDYVDRLFEERLGNVLVVAGDNGRKIDFIRRAIEEGINVLADKPMIITGADFPVLRESLELADANGLLVNDVMTERHAITSILQRDLAQDPELFGELQQGSPEDPAITKESVHFFSKTVAGAPLIRPAWFFDVRQQGEAIVDVSTHLVDLILWQGFPGTPIDYANPADGVELLSASASATPLTLAQFQAVTGVSEFPEYLAPYLVDGVLQVPASGEFLFRARDVHGKVRVEWEFENPLGGDTHYSRMRGTGADLVIRQDAPQNFVATLYVEPAQDRDPIEARAALVRAVDGLQSRYPGLEVRDAEVGWKIVIPDEHRESHEDHFTRVTQLYLDALVAGNLPDWERTNLLTKYFITTQAYEMSR